MNKEYTYIDGKVIVEDTEGNKRQVEYTDNLDEILVEENIIEILEDKIKELEKESSKYQKNYKYNKIFPWGVLGIFALTPTLCFKVLVPMFPDSDIFSTMASTFIGPIDFGTLCSIFFTAFTTPLGILLASSEFRRNKYDLKSEKGRKLALEVLKEELDIAKENLENLEKQKKTVSTVEGFRTEKVKDTEAINHIEGSINLYHDLGHNGEKYYRYYQKHGILPKKVRKHYTELGQEVIEDYLKENKTTLAKTRTRRR